MYAIGFCLGVLVSIDQTFKYFKPKECCFDVPGITPSVFTARSECTHVKQDDLVRALTDVELFRSKFWFLMEMRICFLSWSKITL